MAGARDQLLRLPDADLLGQCEVDRYRASGPGGQKRNKTESAVRLRHKPTGVTAHSADSRSQHGNKAKALVRLREHLAFDIRLTVTVDGYRPPDPLAALVAAGVGRRGAKTRISIAYLTGVAALLDLFVALDCSVAGTAELLGLSTGGLSRLIRGDDRLARKTNELRTARGMRALR